MSDADADVKLRTVEDIEKDNAGIVKRWLAEIALSDAASENYRTEGKKLYELFRQKKKRANAFNILWSNTQTLRTAIYNTTPQPDVRRRFRDADPVGKVAATVQERALSYQIDQYEFDDEISDGVIDMLIPGQGFARIIYEPHFAEIGKDGKVKPAPAAGSYREPPKPATEAPADKPKEHKEGEEEPREKLTGQDAKCAYVAWDKWKHGPGKRWSEIPWISFEHEFNYEMCCEKFGEPIASKLEYTGDQKEVTGADEETASIFKTCVVHEIWDKAKKRVLFIAPTFKERPCLVVEDPLRLREFWPAPRPMRAIRDPGTMHPTALYKMYEEQANELNEVSKRINRIIKHLKVRGAYPGQIPEAAAILDANEEDMIKIVNVSLIQEAGGLDKLLWIMPIEKIAAALDYLYRAREEIKQTIFEISGIADILRGATDPNETLGAQRIKGQWGSLRVQDLQKEVQRFVRDLMRLKAEVISQEFEVEQLKAMTGVELPMQAEKDQAQAALGQLKMQPPPPDGQPPQIPPEIEEILSKPSWEEVKELLMSDDMRQYRTDIETDSTIADTLNQDMQGLSEVVRQIAEILAGVLKGLPMDVAKNIALAVCRRARMGSAVEDALEGLQQPPPQEPPVDNSLEVAQINAQNKVELANIQAQNKAEIANMQEQSRQQIAQIQEESKQQIAQMQEQLATEREDMASRMSMQSQMMSERINAAAVDQKAQLDAAVKIIVANIGAKAGVEQATLKNANREVAEDVT